MAEGFFSKLAGWFPTRRGARPFEEMGISGTAIYGGHIATNETSAKLLGQTRWKTASEILANVSIVAAGVRHFLNLCSRPRWIVEPAIEKNDEATKIAEFYQSVLEGCATSWPRIVRRSGMFKFHGHGLQEWIAIQRPDGMIGLDDIEPRPQHSIERWDVDARGSVLGVIQRSPQDGREYYLPREKLIYLVDDIFTDSPMGMGWFRHLVDPAERLMTFLRLEGIGFQRDLSGTPIGRAPLTEIRNAVKANKITEKEGEALIAAMNNFLRMQSKQPSTAYLMDSAPYQGKTGDGQTISSTMKWGLELLTGEQTSIDKLDVAIRRTVFDMALIIGCENLLTGREGAGSMALSSDKSTNLYLNVNATTGDMASFMRQDIVKPLGALNGIPDELLPKLKVEDAAPKDVEQISRTLRDMAAAGAILTPDDPAIDDLRDLAGISRQPELTPERLGMLMPPPPGDPNADPNSDPGGDPGKDKGKGGPQK